MLFWKKCMNNKITIIGGCGRIGLPVGMAIAELGYFVTLLDINDCAVNTVNNQVMLYDEEGENGLLSSVISSNHLEASVCPECIRDSDLIIFTIGTTANDDLSENNSCIKVVKQYLEYFNDEQVLIFCSTLAPGTMEYINEFFCTTDLRPSLAYCPERVAQGKVLVELKKYPHIISALDNKALEVVGNLFSKLTGKDVIELSVKEAELAKLFCNAARYVNFAIANQFLQIADSVGANFNNIFNAIKRDYPRMQHFKSPGLTAGPCLVKDTYQLAKLESDAYSLCRTALEINNGFPQYIVNKIKQIIGKDHLESITVGILGMSFKANIDDIRDSHSIKLADLLRALQANLLLHDPYLKGSVRSQLNLVDLDLFSSADIIVLGVPHQKYEGYIAPHEIPVVDVWNFFKAE